MEEKRTIIIYAENCANCKFVNVDCFKKPRACRMDVTLSLSNENVDKIHENCPFKHTMYKFTTNRK